VQDYALGHPTEIDNLVTLCRWHHEAKTHKGYRLVGEPGNRRWLAPGDSVVTGYGDPPREAGGPPSQLRLDSS